MKIALGVALGIVIASSVALLFVNGSNYLSNAPQRNELAKANAELEASRTRLNEMQEAVQKRDSEHTFVEVIEICKGQTGVSKHDTYTIKQLDALKTCGRNYGKNFSDDVLIAEPLF